MGDKNPKTQKKNADQKTAKNNASNAKKNAAIEAKKAVNKK